MLSNRRHDRQVLNLPLNRVNSSLINQLFFEGGEEALDIGIIETRPGSCEAGFHACSSFDLLRKRGLLAA